MKFKYQILAIALTISTISCKKDKEVEPDTSKTVEYSITCESCKAVLDVASGKKSVDVKGNYFYTEDNTLPIITVSTTGTGTSTVNIKIAGQIKYLATKEMPAVHTLDRAK